MPGFHFKLRLVFALGLATAVGLIGFAGCASSLHLAVHSAKATSVAPAAPVQAAISIPVPVEERSSGDGSQSVDAPTSTDPMGASQANTVDLN
ncbi:MAG: hypothetical protein KDA72_18980, partial [Planctomycetales bacterium]|nr:hypothetical protein [Planctomycetales bacterium]